jgi:hypothetical protein
MPSGRRSVTVEMTGFGNEIKENSGVSTGNHDMELGRGTGAVTNVILKSGNKKRQSWLIYVWVPGGSQG